MKCKSVESKQLDAYAAGLEVGEALADMNPEVVIVFPSVHFESYEDLYTGIQDAIEDENLIVVGGTGDGFYVDKESFSVGVGAMGLSGEGKVTWEIAISESGTCADPGAVGQACAEALVATQGRSPDLTFCLAPMACDGTHFVEGIHKVLTTPCVGALVGDDHKFEKGMVMVNGAVHEDQCVLLGMWGEFVFSTNLASGWEVVGEKEIVTKADGPKIYRIGNESAFEFMSRHYGSHRIPSTIGNLAFYPDPASDRYFIRTAYKFDEEEGSVTCFGSIREGQSVRGCSANREQILTGASDAMAGMGSLDFEPTGALVISCAGRKWALGERTPEELLPLESLGSSIPVLGIPSFGEIGPHRVLDGGGYGPTFFHNTTFVLTLFG